MYVQIINYGINEFELALLSENEKFSKLYPSLLEDSVIKGGELSYIELILEPLR